MSNFSFLKAEWSTLQPSAALMESLALTARAVRDEARSYQKLSEVIREVIRI